MFLFQKKVVHNIHNICRLMYFCHFQDSVSYMECRLVSVLDCRSEFSYWVEVCSEERKSGFGGGKSGCDCCMLFCNVFFPQ